MLPLSLSTAAFLALGVIALSAGSVEAAAQSQDLLHHRHSFFSTLPVEPSDENLKVSRHRVRIVDLSGFREWEVKGSLKQILKAGSASDITSGSEQSGVKIGSIRVQWFASDAPLLRPPFTPTFVPGFHLAVTSNDFNATWKDFCPSVAALIGGVDCESKGQDSEDHQTRSVRSKDLTKIHHHRYLHRSAKPLGFLSSSSAVSALIFKHGSGAPALIDLQLQSSSQSSGEVKVTLKVIWPQGNAVQGKNGDNVVDIAFEESMDKVVEVGWFYREVTEQAHFAYDHFLGATVKMDAEGEVVSEALIQTRSPVFPPHKRDFSTGHIRVHGHGYVSTMTPRQTFHPSSVTTIHSSPYIEESTVGCDLHVMQVLPPGIFVDPFQLEGLAPEIGSATVYGETDLEKPVGVVSGWGSLVMVKVQPEESAATSRWTPMNATEKNDAFTSVVTIPMHMRYQPPVPENDPMTHVNVAIPWPVVAWACPPRIPEDTTEALAAAAKKLFYIPTLPLSLLFTKPGDDQESVDFRFLLPDPVPKQYPESAVSVPVGRLDDVKVVRTATFVLAAVGTLMVSLALIKAVAGRKITNKGKQD